MDKYSKEEAILYLKDKREELIKERTQYEAVYRTLTARVLDKPIAFYQMAIDALESEVINNVRISE